MGGNSQHVQSHSTQTQRGSRSDRNSTQKSLESSVNLSRSHTFSEKKRQITYLYLHFYQVSGYSIGKSSKYPIIKY